MARTGKITLYSTFASDPCEEPNPRRGWNWVLEAARMGQGVWTHPRPPYRIKRPLEASPLPRPNVDNKELSLDPTLRKSRRHGAWERTHQWIDVSNVGMADAWIGEIVTLRPNHEA